ncbi:MAG: VPLPA-CTERM sorting domain-containing protein [Proteobacteria bacterium]|nr:VPLPA-CTERM sorting domain-containing protein [Pseudomonadota bacterium]
MKLRYLSILLIGFFVLGMCMVSNSYALIYDLRSDWSDVSNPNEVWSYNLNGSPLPSAIRGGDNWGTPQISWVTYPYGHIGWFKSNGTEQFPHDWIAGDIITHTPSGPDYTDITWTSPISGVASISGGVWHTRDWGRTNNWYIYINGVQLASGSVSSGGSDSRNNPSLFTTGYDLDNISISIGDIIQLHLSGQGTGDYAGVNLTIETSTTPVPIPGAIWLFGPGLAGLAGLRRRFFE